MAATQLVPKNGAVVLGSLTADFAAYTITANNSVEGTTSYGTNTMSTNVSAGTPDWDISIAAYLLAHASGTAPVLQGGTTGLFQGTGAACTLTLDTGCSYSGNMVVSQLEVQHGRMRAAVPLSIRGKNGRGDWAETYAVS